jgi:hypothetical protein
VVWLTCQQAAAAEGTASIALALEKKSMLCCERLAMLADAGLMRDMLTWQELVACVATHVDSCKQLHNMPDA